MIELALGEGAAHIDNTLLPVDVSSLECDPFRRPQPGRRREQNHRPYRGPMAEAMASSSAHDSNGCCSFRRRVGLSTPTFAELTSIIPQATARCSTCRSAWVASKR